MSQEQAQKKKPIALIAAVLVVAVAGGILLYGNSLKNQKIQEMKDALAGVPAPYTVTVGDIDASLFGRSLTLTNVKGSLPYKNAAITISADKIEGKGLNPLVLQSSGVSKLSDTLAFTNLVTTGPGFSNSVAFYEIHDLSGDFVTIAREGSVALPVLLAIHQELLSMAEDGGRAVDPNAVTDDADEHNMPANGSVDDVDARLEELLREQMPSLRGLLIAADTLHIGRIAARDYYSSMDMEGERLAFRCASLEGSDYSLISPGPMKMKEVSVKYGDKQIATFSELGMDGGKFPRYADLLGLIIAEVDPLQVQKFFMESEFSIKNLYFKDMKFIVPDVPTESATIAAKAFSVGIDYAKGNFSMTFALDELAANKMLLPAKDSVSRELRDMLPEMLVFSTRNEISLKNNDPLYDLRLHPVSATIKDLGEVSLSIDLRKLSDNLFVADPMLGSMSLKLVDNGVSEVFCTLAGKEQGLTPQGMREQLVFQLNMWEGMLKEPLKEANAALQAFIQNPGGTFTLDIKPEAPMTSEDLQTAVMVDPSKLGLSSSFTPKK